MAIERRAIHEVVARLYGAGGDRVGKSREELTRPIFDLDRASLRAALAWLVLCDIVRAYGRMRPTLFGIDERIDESDRQRHNLVMELIYKETS